MFLLLHYLNHAKMKIRSIDSLKSSKRQISKKHSILTHIIKIAYFSQFIASSLFLAFISKKNRKNTKVCWKSGEERNWAKILSERTTRRKTLPPKLLSISRNLEIWFLLLWCSVYCSRTSLLIPIERTFHSHDSFSIVETYHIGIRILVNELKFFDTSLIPWDN